MRFTRRVAPVLQTEHSRLRIGCNLEPWGETSRRIDADEGAQIVLLLAVEEDNCESAGSAQSPGDVRRVGQRDVAVREAEFVCGVGLDRTLDHRNALVLRGDVYQLEDVDLIWNRLNRVWEY